MDILSEKYSDLSLLGAKFSGEYQSNPPFPSIYIDDFFNEEFLSKVLNEFPDLAKEANKIYYNNPNEDKHASKGDESFGENTKKIVTFLNSQPFLDYIQEMTGIKEPLIADPTFEGGGFHEIKPNGFLKLHVDFHKHRTLNLHRRVNLLVYLNKDWDESYGGHFELWEKDMSKCVTRILPLFNRIALFSTTGDSWHGHPDKLTCPEDRSRRSLALYYYTKERPESEVQGKEKGRVTTTFAARKGVDGSKMERYNSFVNIINKILPNSLMSFLKKFRKK